MVVFLIKIFLIYFNSLYFQFSANYTEKHLIDSLVQKIRQLKLLTRWVNLYFLFIRRDFPLIREKITTTRENAADFLVSAHIFPPNSPALFKISNLSRAVCASPTTSSRPFFTGSNNILTSSEYFPILPFFPSFLLPTPKRMDRIEGT